MRAIFALIFVTSGLVAVTYTFVSIDDLIPNLDKCKCHEYTAECLVEGIESMVPYLEKGIPELLVPQFEPYRTDVNYRFILRNIHHLTLANIRLDGLTKFTTHFIELHDYPPRLKFEMHFPYINMSAIGYSNVVRYTDTMAKDGRKIEYSFRYVKFEVEVRGYTTRSMIDEESEEIFYVNGVYLKWDTWDMKGPMKFFDIGPNTRAQSIATLDEIVKGPSVGPRAIKTVVLSDAAEIIRNITNNMLMKLPLKTLCVN